MQQGHYRHEAEQCRLQAQVFSGRPEERLLLNLAVVFEELASSGTTPAEIVSDGFILKSRV